MAVIGRIRKNTGLLIGIIALAIIGFLVMDATNSQSGVLSQRQDAVGVINGNKISQLDFQNMLESKIEEFKLNRGGSRYALTEEERNSIRNQTWEDLVKNSIMNDKFAALGIRVTDDEMVDMVQGKNPHPAIIQNFSNPQTGQFDPSAVALFLTRLDEDNPGEEPGTRRKSWLLFENALKEERYQAKYNNLINKGMYVPSWQGEFAYLDNSKTVSFDYIYQPYSNIPDADVKISDDDIKQYLNTNKERFKQDAYRKIKYISFPVIPSSSDSFTTLQKLKSRLGEFKKAESDSLFVRVYSDEPFNSAFLKRNEITSSKADSFFVIDTGKIIGPYQEDGYYKLTKVVNRKKIADSVDISSIFLSFQNVTTQEQANKIRKLHDSVYTLIDSLNQDFGKLAAAFSDDPATKFNGGKVGWVKPGEREQSFNDAIFFRAKQGSVIKTFTQEGFHIVKVNTSIPTQTAVKLANYSREIIPSAETQRNIRAQAANFAGKNRTADQFNKSVEGMEVRSVEQIKKNDYTVVGLGSARTLVQWVFKGEKNDVSNVITVDNNHIISLISDVIEEGLPTVDQVRTQVEVEVRKKKKAEMLAKKMNEAKADNLAAIADKVGTTVESAENVSLSNPAFGANYEPKVVATALGIGENKLSKPIEGSVGVFIIQTKTVVQPQPLNDYNAQKGQIKSRLQAKTATRLIPAIKKDADVEDNRFNFY